MPIVEGIDHTDCICRISRMRKAIRLLRLLSCGVAAVLLWACGPVYIPVPPPMEITFTKDLVTDPNGAAWIAAGGPDKNAGNAIFYVFDQQQNAGVIVGSRADGSFQAAPLRGGEGDHVLIHYQTSRGDLSSSICLVLSELRPPVVCQ